MSGGNPFFVAAIKGFGHTKFLENTDFFKLFLNLSFGRGSPPNATPPLALRGPASVALLVC